MAVGAAPVCMRPALRRGNHETACLDGAGAKKHMPVRPAAGKGEGGRNGQDLGPGLRQPAIEMRKSQIVADGQAGLYPVDPGHHHPVAGREMIRFAIGFSVTDIGVEHVDLVIFRLNGAVRTDEELPVDVPAIFGAKEHGPDRQRHPKRGGAAAQLVKGRAFVGRFRLVGKRATAGGKKGGGLGKADQLCPVTGGAVDHRQQRRQGLLGGAGGAILQRGDGKGGACRAHAARSLSRWPALSRA